MSQSALDYPAKVDIELVGRCNEACVYCNWQDRPVKEIMSVGRVCELQDELATIPLSGRVGLHGVGEPTLHPHLVDIIDRGVSLGLSQGFSSNCHTGIPEELADIEDLEVDLAIPWGSKRWNVPVSNALKYLRLKPKNTQIWVQIVCHMSFVHMYDVFLEQFLPFASDNVTLFAKQPLTWPGMPPQEGFIPEPHPMVKVDTLETPKSIGDGCSMPDSYLLALSDGRFAPCCVGHAFDWGLPRDCSIMEAWNSPEMQKVREMHNNREEGILCHQCHL